MHVTKRGRSSSSHDASADVLDPGPQRGESRSRMESRADVSWPSTIALATRAVVGFAAGSALILTNAHGSKESTQFVSHGEAALWMTLLAVQAAFWAVVTSYAWRMARHYLPRRRRDLERIAAS